VIGFFEDESNSEDVRSGSSEPVVRSLVTEEYLRMLVAMSNERFLVNSERKERFRTTLVSGCSAEDSDGPKPRGKARPLGWEDSETRKERMRAEGLRRKKMLESQATQNSGNGSDPKDDEEIWNSLGT
jgi:tRNA wybutosine-synthesizing protein 3